MIDTRTQIQKERDRRKEKMVRLFSRLRNDASKSRAAELVASELGCSKSSVINALNEQGRWK